jgi:hydroxyacylglutathione hydrolase
MLLEGYAVGRLQANCFVVGDEAIREVMVIDPGDEGEALLAQLAQQRYRVTTVIATHHHLDHSGAVHELLSALPDARFLMHALDYPLIAESAPGAATWYGHAVTAPRAPDQFLEHGDEFAIGTLRFRALHCPGHTPGSVCIAGEGVVFTGDVLFQGSIGRSDFPGSDGPTLIRSIREQLLTLPDDTTVYPGHGAPTSIGDERAYNPFLAARGRTTG